MLYDPKWEQKPRDIPTLAGFIAWLDQQERAAIYNYSHHESCAISRYCLSIGTTYWAAMARGEAMIQDWNIHIAGPMPWTFGACAERARSFASGSPALRPSRRATPDTCAAVSAKSTAALFSLESRDG